MRERDSFFARALSIVHRKDELRGVAMGYGYFLVAGVLRKAHEPDLLVFKENENWGRMSMSPEAV